MFFSLFINQKLVLEVHFLAGVGLEITDILFSHLVTLVTYWLVYDRPSESFDAGYYTRQHFGSSTDTMMQFTVLKVTATIFEPVAPWHKV